MSHHSAITHPAELDALLALVRAPDSVDVTLYFWGSDIALGCRGPLCDWYLNGPGIHGHDAILAAFSDPDFRAKHGLVRPEDAASLPAPTKSHRDILRDALYEELKSRCWNVATIAHDPYYWQWQTEDGGFLSVEVKPDGTGTPGYLVYAPKNQEPVGLYATAQAAVDRLANLTKTHPLVSVVGAAADRPQLHDTVELTEAWLIPPLPLGTRATVVRMYVNGCEVETKDVGDRATLPFSVLRVVTRAPRTPLGNAPSFLPCPFCASAAIDPHGWRSDADSCPECEDCGATAPSVAAWNTRPAPPASPVDAPSAPPLCNPTPDPLPRALARLSRPWEPVA